jgi:hypothetical protein
MESYYADVKSEWGLMGTLSYVTAEAEVLGSRQHQRVIANAQQTPIHGRPLFYADTYLVSDTLTVYVYARHKAQPAQFLEALNMFYDEFAKEYDLIGKQFRLILNRSGELTQFSVPLPLRFFSELNQVRFLRISLPVGDVAIEFNSTPIKAGNQLEDCFKRKRLTRFLETPLIGCDLSRTPVLSALMARVHWASEFVSPKILETLAGQLAGETVGA